MFKQLLGNRYPIDAKIADIGCGDGVISKQIALTLGVKTLHMYDPYVPEDRRFDFLRLNDGETTLETKFFMYDFSHTTEKYDIIFLITALHHVMNPE